MRRLLALALLAAAAVGVACLDFDKKLGMLCDDGKFTCPARADANGYVVPFPEGTVCNGGWCFENPLPHGYDYRAVWGSGPGDVWVGGEGALLWHFTGQWNRVDPGIAVVRGIWGKAADDVWFVGGDRVPLRWNGSGFADEPNTTARLSYAVTGYADRVLWGTNEGLFKKSGALGFVKLDLPGTDVDDISLSGTSEQNCWTIRQDRSGNSRELVRCDGVFRIDGGNNASGLQAVWSGNGTETWAGGVLLQLHNPGGEPLTWTDLPSFNTTAGTFVPGAGSEYLAVGPGASVYWPRRSSSVELLGAGEARPFNSVWSSGPNDVWATGLGGLLWHFNGAGWEPLGRGLAPEAFFGLAVVGQDVQAVGSGSVIVRRVDAGAWEEVTPRLSDTELRDISLLPDGGGFAGGYDIRAFFGGVWQVVVPNAAATGGVRSIFVRSATDGWAVGPGLAFQLVEDGSWQTRDLDLPDGGELFGVGGNADHTWAVGGGGGIAIAFQLFPDGGFLRDDPPSGNGLNAVWMPADAGTVVVAGTGCTIWVKDAIGGSGGWSSRMCTLGDSNSPNLWDVWGFDVSDVWAVGERGLVVHGNFGMAGTGMQISPTGLGDDRQLEAVRGAPGHLWVAGQYGVILHREHP